MQVGQAVAVNGAAAFTEYAVADVRMVTPVPVTAGGDGPGPEAAALVLSGVTAAAALEVCAIPLLPMWVPLDASDSYIHLPSAQATAGIKAGEVVAITAAAGGTGHFAVQLALLAGCSVLAIAGGAKKIEAVRNLGSAITQPGQQLIAIDHTSQDVAAELSLHAPQGLDVVYDGVGGTLRDTLLRHLAPGGRYLQVREEERARHQEVHSTQAGSTSFNTCASAHTHCTPAPMQVGYIHDYPHAHGYPPQLPAQGDSASLPAYRAPQLDGPSWVARVPPASLLFWSGSEWAGPEGRRILGRIFPRDAMAIARMRRRVFDLHYSKGKLAAVVDTSVEGGVGAVPEAVEYMLQGRHVGKVVLDLR